MRTEKQITPEVGIGGTMCVGSDEYMVVVTAILSSKRMKVAHVLDDHKDKFVKDENGIERLPLDLIKVYQEYEKFHQDDGHPWYMPIEYSLRKNGLWIQKGDGKWSTGFVILGEANEYMDPGF